MEKPYSIEKIKDMDYNTSYLELIEINQYLLELVESIKVCGNCFYGSGTSLDDTRCYLKTPYVVVSRHSRACEDWKACEVCDNPKLKSAEPELRGMTYIGSGFDHN